MHIIFLHILSKFQQKFLWFQTKLSDMLRKNTNQPIIDTNYNAVVSYQLSSYDFIAHIGKEGASMSSPNFDKISCW